MAMPKIRRALLSVYDKSGLVEFAKGLHSLGVELLSTGGTAQLLRDANIEVIDVSSYTGSPEVFEGRLKTLHPKIHGGILFKRDNKKHIKEADENEIGPIDLVVVNLYPFEKVVQDPACKIDKAIENIDIGGPTMLRAAAKNNKDVAIVVDPSDYKTVLKEIESSDGNISSETSFGLARKAFALSARYESAIAKYLGGIDSRGVVLGGMPDTLGFIQSKVMDLRYGENPHQKAAYYCDIAVNETNQMLNTQKLHGKELSYNNIMDADATLELVSELAKYPFACAIIKHANPCGVAVSDENLADAFEKAKRCDPISAFGGIVGVNKAIDETTASLIAESFFEVVLAPAYDENAFEILSKKKNIRLLKVHDLDNVFNGYVVRQVSKGMLIQEKDNTSLDIRSAKVVTKREPTEEEWKALEFAWKVVRHVKSNAIVFAGADRTIGIGAGQMSRVDSSKIAVMKALSSLKNSCLASDAFFPFRDGVDAAAEAGASAIVQPGGSMRDKEVIAAADEHGMAMVFTGERHFKH